MPKLLILSVFMLYATWAPALIVDLSGNAQARVKLISTGKTRFYIDKKNSKSRLMDNGSCLRLEGEVLKDAIGFDLALKPQGGFELCGKLDGQAFVMRYANGYMLCRGENSQTTGMIPAYAWNNHETRYLFVRRDSNGVFKFFVDGIPALEQKKIMIERPKSKYVFELKAFDQLQVYHLSSASTPLSRKKAFELFCAMVNRKPKQALPTLVIPEFRPPEGDAAFDEKNWKNAARITGFVLMDSGKLCERQTVVLLGADMEGIYVYFKSPVIEKLNGSHMDHDEGFGGDSVEFFFMPTYTETFDYYQFIGNFLESTYDSCKLNRLWNGKWTHKAHSNDKEWISVFRIKDFSTFSAPPPVPGVKWRFNVCRDWQSSTKGWLWSEFANTPGSFLNYNSFAHAIYGGNKFPFFRIDSIAEVKNLTLNVEFEAVNPADSPAELKAVYGFCAPGSFSVTEMSEAVIRLDGNSRKRISLSVPAPKTAGGLAELSIVNAVTGELLYKQSVIL
jgi:hypothetical protein